MRKIFILFIGICILYGCSPLKSSPQEERHQMELTLHEVQTNLDDSRHDIHCMQTEMQIIDSKLKHQEKALVDVKKQCLEKYQIRLDKLDKCIDNMNKQLSQIEGHAKHIVEDIRQLTKNANESSLALAQFKTRVNEFEKEMLTLSHEQEKVAELKNTLQYVIKSLKEFSGASEKDLYEVAAGDSLEKIAKKFKVSVDALKEANNLKKDLIVVGQKLVIPLQQ